MLAAHHVCTDYRLCHHSVTGQNLTQSLFLQAEYHGFGLTVNPSKLSPVNSKPLKAALMRILDEPAFTVSHTYNMRYQAWSMQMLWKCTALHGNHDSYVGKHDLANNSWSNQCLEKVGTDHLCKSTLTGFMVSSASCLLTTDSDTVSWVCAAADYLFA